MIATMLLETLDTARDLGRLNEIAGVLLRHGFGDAVRRLGLADRLQRAGHVLNWEHAADLARIEPPVQVRLAMEELGPTFVKLGQVLAGRADLFGPEWIAEFEKLHSHVPALPLEALRPQLLEDLGAEPEAVFARFDIEPLAAASIAQVHRAALADGTEVIVKIRRPGIETTIESDLRLLARLAAMADAQMPALRPYRPQQLVRELARSLKRELDLAAECHNAERMAKNLGLDEAQQKKVEAVLPTNERQRVEADREEDKKNTTALLAAFAKDGFSAKTLPYRDPKKLRVPFQEQAKVFAQLLPILKPEQREKLRQIALSAQADLKAPGEAARADLHLYLELLPDAEDRDRFLVEARALARLVHPNIVAVHDAGVHRGELYIVMELVTGRSLREWL